MTPEIKAKIESPEAALAALKAEALAAEQPAIRTVKVGDLEWQADVPNEEFTWDEAKGYATSLGDGWRLPTIKELLTLVDYARVDPACSVFPDCPSGWFWSSSAYSGNTSYAWSVDFLDGYTNFYDVSATYRVRCVRTVSGDK